MTDGAQGKGPVHIEPGGDMWGRLRHWLSESMSAIDAGDFSRLPQSLTQDEGRTAREAYETVLMAMEILETGYLRSSGGEGS